MPFIHAENGYGSIQEEVPGITSLYQLQKVVEDVFAAEKYAWCKTMEKISSFTIDHIKLEPGIYVSRKDYVGRRILRSTRMRSKDFSIFPCVRRREGLFPGGI